MESPAEIVPGVIFYSYLSAERREKVCFWKHHTLVLQVSGQFTLESAAQRLSMTAGQVLLIGKNQAATLTKTPLPGAHYETIVISLQEDLLRQIVLEEKIATGGTYVGPPNVLIPANPYLRAYFQSIVPYARSAGTAMTDEMGILKVKEGVRLLLLAMPELRTFLFGDAQPHKIDLAGFMQTNYHYNLPLERFAQLTGRSLSGFKRDFRKLFGVPPRHWLQEKRLEQARYLLESRRHAPSDIYLDLGFESLAHFSHAFKKRYGKAPRAYLANRTIRTKSTS